MSWIAEYDTQGREFPTCVHMTRTTGTMTHGATYVPIEDGQAVRAENAKLLELVRMLAFCNQGQKDCDSCMLNGGDGKVTIDDTYACDGMQTILLRTLGV